MHGKDMCVIDTSTEFGQRAKRRLEGEKVCWLTTVTASGQPKSIPIWYLWQEDGTVLFDQPVGDQQVTLPSTGRHVLAVSGLAPADTGRYGSSTASSGRC